MYRSSALRRLWIRRRPCIIAAIIGGAVTLILSGVTYILFT